MTKQIIFILTILLLSSCTTYNSPPKVQTKYTYHINFKNKRNPEWKKSKWRKTKTLSGYIKYDKNGNELEVGEYGEIWHFREVIENENGTTSVRSGHGRKPKKLNTVSYKEYNEKNKITKEEVWRFKDNEKHNLIYKTIFKYKYNQLINETEFDAKDNIIRNKDYDLKNNVQSDQKNKAIYEPFFRIDGNSLDSVKYDTLNREVERIHYYNGKFLRRTVTNYNDNSNIVTEYIYDDKRDSLWSYTETRYSYFTKKPLRRYWKVLNSTTETKDIYMYNRKKLLVKILHYNVDLDGQDELEYYTKFKYVLYK